MDSSGLPRSPTSSYAWHGDPSLIQNTVRFLSEASGGDELIFRDYPAATFN
jgi:hypothetical protein